jgi:DNA-directed RNA polymerase
MLNVLPDGFRVKKSTINVHFEVLLIEAVKISQLFNLLSDTKDKWVIDNKVQEVIMRFWGKDPTNTMPLNKVLEPTTML